MRGVAVRTSVCVVPCINASIMKKVESPSQPGLFTAFQIESVASRRSSVRPRCARFRDSLIPARHGRRLNKSALPRGRERGLQGSRRCRIVESRQNHRAGTLHRRSKRCADLHITNGQLDLQLGTTGCARRRRRAADEHTRVRAWYRGRRRAARLPSRRGWRTKGQVESHGSRGDRLAARRLRGRGHAKDSCPSKMRARRSNPSAPAVEHGNCRKRGHAK